MVTSSQQLSHFLRHVKGRWHTTHTLRGKCSFGTPRGIRVLLEWLRLLLLLKLATEIRFLEEGVVGLLWRLIKAAAVCVRVDGIVLMGSDAV